MKEQILKAKLRKTERKEITNLRKQNQIPAVVYGHKTKSTPISVSYLDFEKVYKDAGESTLISLEIEGKKKEVLIHDFQLDPITSRFSHVDFYRVNLLEKVEAEVALDFIGVSKAVKDEGGVLVKNIEEIKVKALPKNLPHDIKVDISALKTFEDMIKVSDLPVPENVEVLTAKDEIIAKVMPPRTEEELKALEEKVEEKVEEVEVIKEKPAEEGEEEAGKEASKEAAGKEAKKEEKKEPKK